MLENTDLLDLIANLLRIMVGALPGFLLMTTVLVVSHHRRLEKSGYRGVVRGYTILLGISYTLTASYQAIDLVERMISDAPTTWRTPVALVSMLLGLPGIFMFIDHLVREDRRVRKEQHENRLP